MFAGFLLLGWLCLVASSGFLALETCRDDVTQALQAQLREQSAVLQRDLLRLHQYMRITTQQNAGLPAASLPLWLPDVVLKHFPNLEYAALLEQQGRALLVRQVLPLRLGGEIEPSQDLAQQTGVAARLDHLQQGGAQILQQDSEQSLLLSLYPLGRVQDGYFIAVWLRMQRWLPELSDPDIVRDIAPLGASAAVASWPGTVQVSDVLSVGEQRYRLTLTRSLRAADFRLTLWGPLLLVWALLLLLWLDSMVFYWRQKRPLSRISS